MKNSFLLFEILTLILFVISSCTTKSFSSSNLEEKPSVVTESEELKLTDSTSSLKTDSIGSDLKPDDFVSSETMAEVESPIVESHARGSMAKSKEMTPRVGRSEVKSRSRNVPSQSGLKAGFSDDNKQFNYFISFLDDKAKEVEHYPFDISERITIKLVDEHSKPLSNYDVLIKTGKKILVQGKTFADGTYRFYPSAFDKNSKQYSATVLNKSNNLVSVFFDRNGPRNFEIKIDHSRIIKNHLPLDILFIMDTTGSMGEEIDRLKTTIEIIHNNLSELQSKPKIRFGLVLYKDKYDIYDTEVYNFTDDLEQFQSFLDKVEADGGGDGPEDLESALDDAVNKMDWNEDGLRIAFIVTDADAHLDYGKRYTYIDAAKDAKEKAIKIHTIGTGSLPLGGEYILRQISQLTDGRYIFLTYGESGESEGGKISSVSHHTGNNYNSDKLESIIIKFVKEEVSYQSENLVENDEEYFEANKVLDESNDKTLEKLFKDAVENLFDYSTFKITKETPGIILPIVSNKDNLKLQSEYFTECLIKASVESKRFAFTDRSNIQNILSEIQFQYSGIVDDSKAVEVGEILGAKIMISGTLYEQSDKYELFLKLINVQTAEVLSVSKAKISKELF